jgi:SAM-dependent methyltransferase
VKRKRPHLLDLGCGAGGASWGYHLAGFRVTGVDIIPQPRYPFAFIQADALTFPLGGFDAIHASMPCQLWALATLGQRKAGRVYPDLITPLRPRLEASGVLWVMENVPEAPLRPDLLLCGCMLGLELPGIGQLQRPRVFEMSWRPQIKPVPHRHTAPAISICGHGTPAWQRQITGHVRVEHWREVMGISWTTREELTEAIPPAYTHYVGQILRTVLNV